MIKHNPSESSQPNTPQNPSGENLQQCLGRLFSDTLNNCITQAICACKLDPSSLPSVLKRELRRLEELDGKGVTFNQCLGYCLLSKVYFLEEKAKQSKLSAPRLIKLRKELQERVKNGLRDYGEIQQRYERMGKREKEEEILRNGSPN